MATDGLLDAAVYTSDGKKIGKIQSVSKDHIVVHSKGIVTDEKYQIPVDAIWIDGAIVRLKLTHAQLKHGREFMKGRPNSEFMHGKKESEPKFNLEKQVIHYEPRPLDGKIESGGVSSPPVSRRHQTVFTGDESAANYYTCDMCLAKFAEESSLQHHRADVHTAPTNI